MTAAMTISAGPMSRYGASELRTRRRLKRARGRLPVRGPEAAAAEPAALSVDGTAHMVGTYTLPTSALAVQDVRDLAAGRLRGVGHRGLAREDRDQHVGDHVGALDVGPVRRVGHEPAVLGRVRERADQRLSVVQAEQRRRVGDDLADRGHLRLPLLAFQQADPLLGEVLRLAL